LGRAASKAAWLFVVLALSASLLYPAHAMRRETLKLLTAQGTHAIDVEIAASFQFQVEAAVVCEQFEHVIEETNSG